MGRENVEHKIISRYSKYDLFLQNLEAMLAKLTAEFETATMEKLRCQQEADRTNRTIELANRLVNGLASENVRWAQAVDT